MQNYNLMTLKVLIVEDSTFMVKLYRIMLSAFGINKIEHVSTLRDFRLRLKAFQPDLILTDWEMPDFSGEDVVKIIRHNANPRTTFTPTFAVSGYTEPDKIQSMLMSGVDDLIAKPVSAADLYHRISRFIVSPPQYVRGDHYFGPERNLRKLAGEKKVAEALEGKEDDVVWL